MLSFWTKSILTLPWVGLAILNLILMLEFLGRNEKRLNPQLLRQIHRFAGIGYIALFVLVAYFCLKGMRGLGQELSARAALHGLLAVATIILLLLKLSFVKFYRKYYSLVPTLGFAVVVLTLITAATSAGYYFIAGSPMVMASVTKSADDLASKGALLFRQNCSACHYSDRTDTKVGPGLKGLFRREALPVSGSAVTEENIRKQLTTPYRAMPSFGHLTEEEIRALLAFLRSL